MIWQFEITDTFGGEANYSWVRRAHVTRAITRWQARDLALRWAGWLGVKVAVAEIGGTLEIKPRGMSMVMFVTDQEAEHAQGACIDSMLEEQQ